MKIKEISFIQFDEYAKNHPLCSYHQSSNYALLMSNHGYDYDYVAYVDDNDKILAASLILYKKINRKDYYGYAPKGFLIDYTNNELLKNFTRDLKDYYRNKKFIFIKINPEIAVGEINVSPYQVKYNQNVLIRTNLKNNGYLKLKDNIYFESLIPRFNGIVYLPNFNYNNLKKNLKNKITQANRKGLNFEKVDRDKIEELYKFIKSKKKRDKNYYKDYYNIFEKSDACDIFLVSINYEEYLLNTKTSYENQLEENNRLNEILHYSPTTNNVNKKMNSDRTLLKYKTDIIDATNGLRENKKIYIAGAMTIKYKNRVYIIVSGYDKKYARFNPNHFLHYEILKYYQQDYTFVDLNGLTGDFTNDNPYYGLNQFKLEFKPRIYEFIGEFDLLINESKYIKLSRRGILAKEFNKKEIKKNKTK